MKNKILAAAALVAVVSITAFSLSSNCCEIPANGQAAANTECCADQSACDTQAGTCCGIPCCEK